MCQMGEEEKEAESRILGTMNGHWIFIATFQFDQWNDTPRPCCLPWNIYWLVRDGDLVRDLAFTRDRPSFDWDERWDADDERERDREWDRLAERFRPDFDALPFLNGFLSAPIGVWCMAMKVYRPLRRSLSRCEEFPWFTRGGLRLFEVDLERRSMTSVPL